MPQRLNTFGVKRKRSFMSDVFCLIQCAKEEIKTTEHTDIIKVGRHFGYIFSLITKSAKILTNQISLTSQEITSFKDVHVVCKRIINCMPL